MSCKGLRAMPSALTLKDGPDLELDQPVFAGFFAGLLLIFKKVLWHSILPILFVFNGFS
jgi:hypothetical protein